MNPGTRIGPYEVNASIGAGGMGEVFRARDTRLNRDVAIKVLPKNFVSDADRLRRFEQEAKTLAALNHPNVLTIHDAGVHESAPYLVSELLEGKTLREEMNGGALPLRKATDYALQTAHGLAAAHGKGVIHRDLKPENIFVTKDGRVKILDFGLAKLRAPSVVGRESSRALTEDHGSTEARPTNATIRIDPDAIINTTEPGMVLGTPAYMSPEQVRGEPADHRADIFAFGCVLYEMLSGTRAFRRGTPVESMNAVLNETLPELSTTHPNIPLPLARIVERCLEKQPDDRFQSAKDLAFALSALAVGSSAARSPTGEPVAARPAVKRFAWPAVAAVLAVSLAVLSVGWWRTNRTPGRASQVHSLAVLPFAFETQDPKLSGLGKWIPAEIRSKLGPLQDLQVVNSPARIEQLVQQKKSEVEIARELGVDGLVMGELHGQGETMSAYVWVVDGSTGRALGKQREIASSADKVFELPNLVALAIVDELKLQVSTSQRTEIQTADTQNAEAYLAYQKGRDLLSRRLNAEAAVEFRRAYQLDTNYTRAWTGLANSEWIPVAWGGTTNEMAATFKRLSAEAERFRAQRPDDPAAASLRMWMAMLYERDWNKVRTTFWESQRNPKPEPWVWNAMSWYYTYIEGHPEQALNARQQTIAMEPENFLLQIDRPHQLYCFGQFDEALRLFRSFPPEKIQLEDYSYALRVVGDLSGAKEVATRVLAGRPNARTQCSLAAIHAKSGDPDEARKILRELEAQAEQGIHIPYAAIASSYGMLGDFESARRWLRKGLLEGHGDWTMLGLRAAMMLEVFGKLAWYWEIVDAMKFPPLQMDNPYFALEQAMRYGRGSVGSPTPSTSTNEPPKTLAVLPFVNLSADKGDEYLSDGMTEELLNVLAQVPGLRVPGRSSSFAFKGKTEEGIFRKVGEQLRVATVLEGSVRKAGDKLRITAQLINVADGFHLWSTNYDREMKDILAVQTEVAQQVAQVLQVKLGVEATRALAKTQNPEAHRLYLLGRHYALKATDEDNETAVKYFNQALKLDPNYARAHAGLADTWDIRLAPKEMLSLVRVHAETALRLDPDLAEAHCSKGWILMSGDWDFAGAERAFAQAIKLNPNLAWAYDGYGWPLMFQGRFEEAEAAMKKAVDLEPLAAYTSTDLAFVYECAREFDKSIDAAKRAVDLDSRHPWAHHVLGWSLLHQGKPREAIPHFEQVRKLGENPIFRMSLGCAYAAIGERAKAEAVIKELDELAARRYVPAAAQAYIWTYLNEKDRALTQLERSVVERDPTCPWFKVDPAFAPLRAEPRFQALLKKVGF